jgi:hypothetical protein
MNLTTGQQIDRTKQLLNKIHNAGSETSLDEVNYIDEIKEEIANLLDGFPQELKNLILLKNI